MPGGTSASAATGTRRVTVEWRPVASRGAGARQHALRACALDAAPMGLDPLQLESLAQALLDVGQWDAGDDRLEEGERDGLARLVLRTGRGVMA